MINPVQLNYKIINACNDINNLCQSVVNDDEYIDELLLINNAIEDISYEIRCMNIAKDELPVAYELSKALLRLTKVFSLSMRRMMPNSIYK